MTGGTLCFKNPNFLLYAACVTRNILDKDHSKAGEKKFVNQSSEGKTTGKEMRNCTAFPGLRSGMRSSIAHVPISVRMHLPITPQIVSRVKISPSGSFLSSQLTLFNQNSRLALGILAGFNNCHNFHASWITGRRMAHGSLQVPDEQHTTETEQHSEDSFERKMQMKENVGSLLNKVQFLEFATDKPEHCTAEELHYVAVPGTDWRLALWRYPPRPQAPTRNHPLLLLSGLGTNAIGFDLDPSVSLARFMSEHGFDTWILEVRGSGLSERDGELAVNQIPISNGAVSDVDTKVIKSGVSPEADAVPIPEKTDASSWTNLNVANSLSDSILKLSGRLRSLLDEGQSRMLSAGLVERISNVLEEFQLSEKYVELRERLTRILEERQNSVIAMQMVDLSKRLVKLLEDGQRSVSPQFSDLQDTLMNTIDDFQKLLDLIAIYDWDFDNLLEEDLPAAMDYIRNQTKPKDGKLHAIGHSMGGIVLYALLATKGQQCGLVSTVTLASSLDYGASDSSLKLLLPLADPAQALNVPAVPLGALMAAIHPLASRPPYTLAWLSPQVSARDMMDAELLEKLVLNNFCTIPANLLLQLTTVFKPGGLQNRSGNVLYKENLSTSNVPVLAIAGNKDLICPPEAVLDTVNALPQDLVTYKLFGGQNECHYGHYDLVCGRMAGREVHPCIRDFIVCHDDLQVPAQ